MRLPNAERAVVEERKITEYLLSFSSRQGASKARFFTRFGFSVEQWEVFAEALRVYCAQHDVVEVEETSRGIKYVIIGVVATPDGRDPRIRSVWQIAHGTNYPRFVTARPQR